jgi:signal transduction histidine kinase
MNRFASAGEMSASIAHEIRQPLAAIANNGSASLNWLKRKAPDLDEVRILLQDIINESHRADDIIKSVRAMFRNDSPAQRQIDLNELIRQVIALAGSIKSNNIMLDSNLTEDAPPLVMADPVQLQQVVLNLIMNAVEAMSHSGDSARSQLDGHGTVPIKVADSGPSIDPKVAERMFQPFFTTKPGGMGMGLAICKTIIQQHGGSLTASPTKPHGMEFQILLPIASAG